MSDTTAVTAATTDSANETVPGQNGAQAAVAATAPEAKFTQADLDRLVDERLLRQKALAEAATKRALEKAAEEAQARSGEWEALAQQRSTKVAELEAQTAQLTAQLEARTAAIAAQDKALRAQLDALRKPVPKHVLGLLDKLTPAEQLEWLAANQEAAQPLPKPAGVPGTPKPAGQLDAAQTEAGRAAVAAQYREL